LDRSTYSWIKLGAKKGANSVGIQLSLIILCGSITVQTEHNEQSVETNEVTAMSKFKYPPMKNKSKVKPQFLRYCKSSKEP